MCNRGFTLAESLIVLCLCSFLILLTSIRIPSIDHLSMEMKRIKEYLLQAQSMALNHHEIIQVTFTPVSLWIDEYNIPYQKGITGDAYTMKYYEDGTISQAKTICLRSSTNEQCFYMQLGSGYIDIR